MEPVIFNNTTEESESSNWMARTGLNEESLCAAVEALIYVTDKPMSLNKIRDAIDVEIPLKVLHQSIEKLQNEYEKKHHGLRLQEVAMGYQFRTKATYSKIIQSHLKISIQALTPATLEVLAIICYQQPISKSKIDLLRGVDSSHLVKTLIDKKLVTSNGRAEDEPGKPSLYTTTSDFLEFFNLSSIDNLPKYAELEELAELDVLKSIPQVKDILNVDNKNVFDFDDLVEIDEIAGKIKDIRVDTDFTKKLKNPTQEIITINEENQEEVKSTVHLSAFDILENFIGKAEAPADATTNTEVSSLKEVGEEELEALLDAAFDRLTDIESKTNTAREEFLKNGDDDERLN